MQVRSKITLVILATMCCLAMVAYGLSRAVFQQRAVDGDSRQVHAALDRLESLMRAEMRDLDRFALDWSTRDDTYRFMRSGDRRYVRDNLSHGELLTQGIGCLVCVRTSGDVVHAQGISPAYDREAPVPESLLGRIAALPFLSAGAAAQSGVTGMLMLPEWPVLLASRPVAGDRDGGAARGALIAGRYLSPAKITEFERLLQCEIVFSDARTARPPAGLEMVRAKLTPEEPVAVLPENDDRVRGWKLMQDLAGRFSVIAGVRMPRLLYGQYRANLRYLTAALFAVTLLSCLALFVFFDRMVRRPLSRLSALVAGVQEAGRPLDRPGLEGCGEIAAAAEEINRMLTRLGENAAQRHQAEQGLARSRDFLEMIINNSPDGILVADAQSNLLRVNASLAALLGYENPDGLVGRDSIDLSPMENGEYPVRTGGTVVIDDAYHVRIIGFWDRILSEEMPQQEELYLKSADGMLVPVEASAVALRNEEGGLLYSLTFIRDITMRKRAEAALMAARTAAEEASRAKSYFLANMSHEIRTALNGVTGFTDMLLETRLDHEQIDFVSAIKHSGEMLLALINEILDFSRIEAGKVEIEDMEFDIEVLAYDVCDLIRPRVQSPEVRVLCRIGDSLPSLVKGDPHRIRQVLVNLMGNAAKFTERGEIELSADIEEVRGDAARIHVRVRDTGIGIPQFKLESIFEAFQQAGGPHSRRFGGAGLGLAICRRIARVMGGDVWAESTPGQGSTFHFTARLTLAQERQKGRLPSAQLPGRRVLVLEDSPANPAMLTHMLETAGIEVTVVCGAEEAVQAVREARKGGTPFDACMVDVMKPHILPGDLARELRKAAGDRLPLLALSLAAEGGMKKFADAGFSGYLPKPVHRVKLLRMLEWLVSHNHGSSWGDEDGLMATHHLIRENVKHAVSILLVEDNPVNQKLAMTMFEKAGYHTSLAGSGREAVSMVKTAPDAFDLIFMDIQMPDLNGIDATLEIRELEKNRQPPDGGEGTCPNPAGPGIPIIAMTAHAMQGDRERCLSAGMNDYIAKPIKREKVFEVLEKWIFSRN